MQEGLLSIIYRKWGRILKKQITANPNKEEGTENDDGGKAREQSEFTETKETEERTERHREE